MSPPASLRLHATLPTTTTSSATAGLDGRSGGHLAGPGHGPSRRLSAARWPPPLRTSDARRNAAVRGGGEGGGGGFVGAKEPTFYELLGISEEGSFEDIRAAYRRMARKYHPDVSPPGAAVEHTRRFIEVQEAYETLSDPSRRASYDRALARGLCRLAFAASRRGFDEGQEEKSDWRNTWQDQVAELKRRSMVKDSEENLSWGARMRRRRAESSTE